MKWAEIIKVFEDLARSQGLYGRLLREIERIKTEEPERFQDIVDNYESQNFKSAVDVVMFVEC